MVIASHHSIQGLCSAGMHQVFSLNGSCHLHLTVCPWPFGACIWFCICYRVPSEARLWHGALLDFCCEFSSVCRQLHESLFCP